MAILVPDEEEIVVQEINILLEKPNQAGSVLSPFGAL